MRRIRTALGGTVTRAWRMAAAPTPGRDRYLDFLRVLSIGVVVVNHWLAGMVWRDGEIAVVNVLAVEPRLQPLSWLLMVVPVFFFVGGAVNLIGLDAANRRGGGAAGFVQRRVVRLLVPTAVYAVTWTLVLPLLWLVGFSWETVELGARGMTRILWFVAAYLAVLSLAPLMLRLHRRVGVRAAVGLAAGVGALDLAGALLTGSGNEPVWLHGPNHVLVWLFAQQLGFLYGDGRLLRAGRRTLLVLTGSGLAVLVLLVGVGPYPVSMVGLPGAPSNAEPPNLAMVVLTVWLVGLVMLARQPVTRILQQPLAWGAVVVGGMTPMTVFLWHPSAAVIGAGLVLPAGFPQPDPGTDAWWLLRPLWLLVLVPPLALLTAVFARFELFGVRVGRQPRPTPDDVVGARDRLGLATGGGLLAAVAVAGLTWFGLLQPHGISLACLALLGVAALILRRAAVPAGSPWLRPDPEQA